MSNMGNTEKRWIDRDTYQKNLQTIAKLGFMIPPSENIFKDLAPLNPLKSEPASLKVIVSGFYNEAQRAFINAKIRIRNTKLMTKSFYPLTENTKIPVLTFQLKEEGEEEVLEEIKRLILKNDIKLLYNNKPSVKKPFPFSHVMAVFSLPADYKERNLRITVLNPWQSTSYTAPIPKKRSNFKK